jgi:hypothetical protein
MNDAIIDKPNVNNINADTQGVLPILPIRFN